LPGSHPPIFVIQTEGTEQLLSGTRSAKDYDAFSENEAFYYLVPWNPASK
jgi:hypothetical protein